MKTMKIHEGLKLKETSWIFMVFMLKKPYSKNKEIADNSTEATEIRPLNRISISLCTLCPLWLKWNLCEAIKIKIRSKKIKSKIKIKSKSKKSFKAGGII